MTDEHVTGEHTQGGHTQDGHAGHAQHEPGRHGHSTEGALLMAALRDAANAWTERVRTGVEEGNSTCGVCPICLTVAHVGHEHPDLVQRLTEAASALGAAMSAASQYYQATTRTDPPPAGPASQPPDPGPRSGGRRKVQHITVTD